MGEGRATCVRSRLTWAALIALATSLLGTAVLSAVLATGVTALEALTGATSPVDATCTGWPSTSGVPTAGHHFYDFNTGSSSWSTGPTKVALPSSYTCSAWIRAYRYNALTVNTGSRWYWIKSSGTFGTYMNTTSGATANFPVASSGIAQNTSYGFGEGYGSCSTDYGSAVGWTTSARPGANCGTPAIRYPDGNGPRYDWTAPTLTASVPTYSNSRTVPVTYSSSDGYSGISGVHAYHDNWVDCGGGGASGTINCTVASDGTFPFYAIAWDNALNTTGAGPYYSIVDTVGPDTPTFTQPSGDITTNAIAYSWTWNAASDAAPSSGIKWFGGSLYSAPLTGGTCGAFTWTGHGAVVDPATRTWTESPLTPGTCYQFRLSVTDNANNVSGTRYSGIVKVVNNANSACISYGTPAGCTTGQMYAGEFDTQIESGANANNNYWNNTAQSYLGSKNGITYRSLMYVPHASLPDGAQVISANLVLSVISPNPGGATFKISRALGSWTTTTTPTDVTWNNAPAADTANGVTVAVPYAGGTFYYVNADVTSLVRAMYSRNATAWKGDFGFLLQNVDELTNLANVPYFYPGNPRSGPAPEQPMLQITYSIPGNNLTFDTTVGLGPNFAPSSMVSGTPVTLPVALTNNTNNNPSGNASFTFPYCAPGVTDCYKVGYRWFDNQGVDTGLSGTADLAADLAAGATATVNLPVAAPPTTGQYSLRLDLVHVTPQGSTFSSDAAYPGAYYARVFANASDPTSTRMVGVSPIQRAEFGVGVVSGAGALGQTQTVKAGDSGSLGINLFTRNLVFTNDTGLSVPDVGTTLGVSYYYNSRDTGSSGMLGASGWGTNWDEQITKPASGGDYSYRDPQGNVFTVSADSDGNIAGVPGKRFERVKATVFDENVLPPGTWTHTAPTISTTYAYSGSNSIAHSSADTAGSSILSDSGPLTVHLQRYPVLSFAARTSAASGTGLAWYVVDRTTGVGQWFVYTVGTDFTPPGYPSLGSNLTTASPIGVWQTVSRNILADAQANLMAFTLPGTGSVAHATDDFAAVNPAFIGNGTAGTDYFDAISFVAGATNVPNYATPSWAQGSANVSGETSDVVANDTAFQVIPSDASGYPTTTYTAAAMNATAYASWSWKKSGGGTVAITFNVKNGRTGAIGTVTYYAGPTLPPGASPAYSISVGQVAPGNWTRVTKNLLDDARQIYGWYSNTDPNDPTPGTTIPPVPDPVSTTGWALVVPDGAYARFDAMDFQTLPDAPGLILPGQTTPYLVGNTTANSYYPGEDFALVAAENVRHVFNLDGRLTRVIDANGNATTLTYNYNFGSSGGPSAYSLTKIAAPSDGKPNVDGTTAARSLGVASTINAGNGTVTFTENIGATGDVGHVATFNVSGGDLASVVGARYVGQTACSGSAPNNCVKFDYTGAHLLAHVYDPRGNGTTSGASGNYYEAVTWDASNYPVKLTDGYSGSASLNIFSWNTGSGSVIRPKWQNADEIAGSTVTGSTVNYAHYTDFDPNGGVLNDWVPLQCTTSPCNSSGATTPAAPSAATGLQSTTQFDAAGNLTSVLAYRLAGNQLPVVSRSGTFARALVDNLPDPITASETAWTQTPDQYLASLAAGDPTLYRTINTYDAWGRVVDATTSFSLPQTSYAYNSAISNAPGLAGRWRLDDAPGSGSLYDAGGNHPLTLQGAGNTLGVSGSIIGDSSNSALSLGATGYASGSIGTIAGTYSVEAWVKPSTTTGTTTVFGSRGPTDSYGSDLKFVNGKTVRVTLGNGSSWFTCTYSACNAPFVYASGTWYHVVEVVSGLSVQVYVDGSQVLNASLSGTGSPILADATHNLYVGQYGGGGEYWAGSVDEFAVYNSVLTPATIAAHYQLGHAMVSQDIQSVYDASGNLLQSSDNTFLTNGGFEQVGLAGWHLYGTPTYDKTVKNSGYASLQLSGDEQARQVAQLLPGQTFRLQLASKATAGAAHWQITYQRPDGSSANLVSGQDSSTSWSNPPHAYDLTLPQNSNGVVQVLLYTSAGEVANFDDVVLMTNWVQNTYNANGTLATSTGIDPTNGATGTRVTKYDYGDPHGYAAANLIANGGFTAGQSSWTSEGSGTFATATSDATYTIRDGEVSGYNLASGPWGTIATLTLPASSSGDLAQTVSATGGTTYSASALVGETNLTRANVSLSFLDGSGNVLGTYTSANSTVAGGTDRGAYGYLVVSGTAPSGTTQLKVGLNGAANGSGGTLRLDAVSVVASSIPQPYLPSQKVPAGTFVSKTTADYVYQGGSTADQNVVSLTAYDRWGRGQVAIDPDGVATMSGYATNGIDVAAKSDGLGDVNRTTSWDAVGNPITSLDPAGFVTSDAYNIANLPTDVTTPDGKVRHVDYDAAYRAIHTYANYSGGGSPRTGVLNVEQTTLYNQYGQAARTVADDGGIGVVTDKTYDLLDNIVDTTQYPSGTTGGRTTTSYFAKVSYTDPVTQVATTYSATKVNGTALPSRPAGAPAPVCPGETALRCDAVSVVDSNGRLTSSIDAFGKVGGIWYDFDGRPVRIIANYVPGGGLTADQNVISTTRYDTRGRAAAKTDPLGNVSSKTYDHLDRITKATNADGSWTRTDYTPAGRTLQVSLTGGSGGADGSVAWTSTSYDGAGRAVMTRTNDDRTSALGYTSIGFETNTTEGFTTGRAYSLYAVNSLTVSSSKAQSGAYALTFTTDAAHGSSEGVFAPLGGSLHPSDTYNARLYAYSATATTIAVSIGDAGGESSPATCDLAAGTWTPCTASFGAGTSTANGYVKVTAAASSTVILDAVSVWDASATLPTDVPSSSVIDARGLPVASVLPPGHAGDPALVTTTTYDNMARTTSVTVNTVAGSASTDANLTTSYGYDALGHRTDTTDPALIVTHLDYDRLGRVVAGTANYKAGQGRTVDQNVEASTAYDNLDEVLGTCEPSAYAAGCNAANPSDARAWHYTYDPNGHVVTQTPPVNAVTAANSSGFVYDANTHTRLISTCSYAAGGTCATADRHADVTAYDNVGRAVTTVTYVGAGTGSAAMTATNGYDAVGNKVSVAFDGTASGEGTDTLTFDYDSMNRLLHVYRAGVSVSSTAYNPNGTVASRTDPAGTSNFTYDTLQRLVGTTGPTYTGSTGYTWRLDGLVDTRTWPGGMATATFAYDGAKRPISETIGTTASFSRTYDRSGTVTSETQNLAGISGLAGSGTQHFKYDNLSRVTCSYFGDTDNCASPSGTTETYAYDSNSNRTSWNNGGVVTTYAYDALDELETATTAGIVHTFAFDAQGNLTSETISGDSQAPTVPTNVAATASAFDVVSVTWTAATDNVGVSRYAIYRDGTLLAVVDGASTSFTDRSTVAATGYSYTVSAVDAAGNSSAQSAGANVTTPAGSGVIATVTVGSGPYTVAITPNGNYAYVANESSGTVSVVRISDNTVVSAVTVGSVPYTVAITPNGAYAYVANYNSGTVSVIRTSDNTVVSTLTVGPHPNAIAITPNGNYAYVANYSGGNVSVIRTSDNTVVSTVTVGPNPNAIAITPDGNYAYVANNSSGDVSVIRTSDNTVVSSVTVGSTPNAIAITPDGNYAYVANQSSGNVSVIRTSDNTAFSTVTVGSAPCIVAITPDGNYAYVANLSSGTVSVIRTSDNTVVSTVTVGSAPYTLAITPNGNYAYVSNYLGGTVSVIGTPGDTVAPTVPGTPVIGAVTSSTIALSWSASSDSGAGVQGYKVYRDGTQIGTVLVGTASFVDTGLTASTSHTYTVAAVDGAGNASVASSAANGTTTAVMSATSYTYDAANRMKGIVEADGTSVGFTFDALGRHATRTANGATIDVYSYVGLDDVVVRDQSPSATVDSAIDGLGARIATKTGSGGFGWALPDLHGNVACMALADGSALSDAFRYDAYGRTIGAVTSSLPTPWRFQGKLLESTPGQPDLYDFQSRSYAPELGQFTQLDTVSGSALNPITLNRYLYAGANPETLVDPDGHCWGICIDINPIGALQSAAQTVGNAAAVVAPVVASVAATAVVTVVLKNPVAGPAFIAASTVAGAAGAAAGDIASGHMPDIKHVAAGAVSGATFGAVMTVTGNWTAAGAASGAAGDAFTQTWEIIDGSRQGYDLTELGTSTALGAAGGYIGGRVAARYGNDPNAKVAPDKPSQAKLPGNGDVKVAPDKAGQFRPDFIVGKNGLTIPASRSVLEDGFGRAGFPSSPTRSAGTQWTLPNGNSVRIMEPSGPAPLRASFENTHGDPINPFTGKAPQPTGGRSGPAWKRFSRTLTHIDLRD